MQLETVFTNEGWSLTQWEGLGELFVLGFSDVDNVNVNLQVLGQSQDQHTSWRRWKHVQGILSHLESCDFLRSDGKKNQLIL